MGTFASLQLFPPIGGGENKNASLRRLWSVVWLALARGYWVGMQSYRHLLRFHVDRITLAVSLVR
jgi:hypothetical protein